MKEFDDYIERETKAEQLYKKESEIYNPYFGKKIILNSDGWNHLHYSNRIRRNKNEILLKLGLLPQALEIVRKSGTVQEYREMMLPIGNTNARGEIAVKRVDYWAMIAIVGDRRLKVRVVLRRVGDGKIVFWSVMPYTKIKKGKQSRLYSEGIDNE